MTKNSRPLGGPNFDLSPVSGAQTEVAVAVDPRRPRVLLAGANDDSQPRFRAFASIDGGRQWIASLGPPMRPTDCSRGDPAVAIDDRGREYYAFIRSQIHTVIQSGVQCPGTLTTQLEVATRNGPSGRWHRHVVAPPAYVYGFDDKPALAATASGRVYVVWSRLFSNTYETTVVSHTDDGGKTWSRPVRISRTLVMPQLVSVGVGARDTLYVTGVDARYGIWITSTRDGTHFEPVRRVARLRAADPAHCSAAANEPLGLQAQRCVGPNPSLAVLPHRIVVVYGDATAKGTPAVYAVALDDRLRVVGRSGRLATAPNARSRQFWPVAAADTRHGVAWACYYDTTGSSNNRRAWFTCTTSRTGVAWRMPIRAASTPSVVDSLFEDGFAFGTYPGLAVGGGVAHPAWIDTRRAENAEDIFTAAIPTLRARRLERHVGAPR